MSNPPQNERVSNVIAMEMGEILPGYNGERSATITVVAGGGCDKGPMPKKAAKKHLKS